MATEPLGRVRISGLRSLDSVDVFLRGLTVLIGENGSGKSSILEGLEILRRASQPKFAETLVAIHGGAATLLRRGADAIRLDGDIGSGQDRVQYKLATDGVTVLEEHLLVGPYPGHNRELVLIQRRPGAAKVYEGSGRGLVDFGAHPGETLLSGVGRASPHPALMRMKQALEAIDVQAAFDVQATWIGRAHGRESATRKAVLAQSTDRLERLGGNLPNAFHELRNQSTEHWNRTMELVRLGLGDWVDVIITRHDRGAGHASVYLRARGRDDEWPITTLSDGQVAYLAFVALCRLGSQRSVLAFDEPELHLHPGLVDRVVALFSDASARAPVLLSTHSRRLLDALDDPVGSTILCDVDRPSGGVPTTSFRKANKAAFEKWLEKYEGLGAQLDAGYGELVMTETAS